MHKNDAEIDRLEGELDTLLNERCVDQGGHLGFDENNRPIRVSQHANVFETLSDDGCGGVVGRHHKLWRQDRYSTICINENCDWGY